MKIKQILQKHLSSFQLRIFLALALVIAIFIPGTGYLGYLQALRVAENQMEQYAIGTAAQISERTNSFLAQHSYNVTLLASLFETELINSADNKTLLQYFHLFKKGLPEFANIYYGDEQGRFTMAPPQPPEVHKIYDPRNRPWYTGAKQAKTTHWTDVYLFASTQKPGITVSSPVYNKQGILSGICGIDIDLIAFSRFLQGIDIGKQSIAYIFENTTGRIITHSWLKEQPDTNEYQKLIQECRIQFKEQQTTFGITSHKSEQFFTAYTQYPGKDWTVGVTLSTADYLVRMQIIKQTTITLIIAAILLSSLLSFLLSKSIISPLLKLQQGIDRIGSGNLEHRVEVTAPDIARDLARSFNKMALSLRNSLVELKATYAALQEKEKLAAVGKMTAGIAHEIKNPLGIIMGSTQVVLDPQRPWEMREKAASFIMDEVVRLDTTLKAFLAFAKPATPVFSEIDVARLFEETISAIEGRYLEEGYSIDQDFKADLPLIEADPGQIRQILMNILLNAFDAMPEGGAVNIRIKSEKEPDIVGATKRFISIRNPFTVDRDWLIVSIQDKGCGISEEHLKKILDPFVSFRDDGIGLGLSIVSQLVKLHRGHIQIESVEGIGTTFHLYFPCILKEPFTDVEPAAC